jgi:CO/xanthine dehydrogenase FAD-binding subunit
VKPAPFAYAAPRALTEALRLLETEEQAIALAGGQSLVPLLNFRLARPSLLVDLNQIRELDHVTVSGETLRIGALTRQAALERSAAVELGWPLLTRAVRLVAHPAIRSRGTVGGSLAHADPRAELPVALIALGARLRLSAVRGERTVPAREFFLGPMRTALQPGELLIEIEVPPLPGRARTAFVEHARTHGDFAIAAAATVIAPTHAAIALLGAGPVPVLAPAAERALLAGAPATEVAALAAEQVTDDYRRALLTALVARAIETARR